MKTTIELPDGVLQEGETLRVVPQKQCDPDDFTLAWLPDSPQGIARKRVRDLVEPGSDYPRILIVPRFSMQAWIDKALPLLTTKKELWIFWHHGDEEWYSSTSRPNWHKHGWSGMSNFYFVTPLIGGPERPQVHTCHLIFKWCLTWYSGTRLLEVKGCDKVAGRGNWAWLWVGGEQ